MVQFMNSYHNPLERIEGEDISVEKFPDIEAPIIPIGELGTTAIDVGAQGNVLTNLDKSIRMGTKKIQLIISGGGQGNPSMLASSHGKDVRAEIAAKAKATGVEITGVELSPQRIASMSGFNQQSHSITEEQRQNDIRQVKYAIKFAADVAGGGGVDIWSQEFHRTVFDADWNKGGAGPGGKMFFDNSQDELKDISQAQLTKYLIDKRSGRIEQQSVVHTNNKLHIVDYQQAKDNPDLRDRIGKPDRNGHILRPDDYVDIYGNYVDRYDPNQVAKLVPKINSKTKQFEMKELDWKKIEEETRIYNEKYRKKGEREWAPEEWAYRLKLLTNMASVRGYSQYYYQSIDVQYEQIKEKVEEQRLMERLEKNMNDEERRLWVKNRIEKMQMNPREGVSEVQKERLMKMKPSEVIADSITRDQIGISGSQELVTTYKQQEEELKELWSNVTTPGEYAKGKTFDSYAQAGVYAMQVTKERQLEKPVYVGPEIGWAGQQYGGHPEEFKETVLKSREHMVEMLKKQGYSESSAQDAAKKHIKGMLDTSHMTMWYKHFVRKPGESEDAHLDRFNKWAQDQAKSLVKAGVVGGVQIVDSITGEHAHLPVGQGIFKVTEIVKAMKEAGFDGPIVSEGHEEEGITQGRILTETWRAFGSPIRSMSPGQRGGTGTWRGVQYGYFGMQMPHTYIVGAYAPSNDWQLWSETPFE